MTEKLRIADLPEAARTYLRQAYDRLRERLTGTIATHGRTEGLSSAVARERIAVMTQEMAPIYTAMEAAQTPVACARGCGCCCSLTVDVSPDEVFALIAYLDENLSEEDLTALKARAAAADAQGHGLEPLARHRKRIMCPVQDPATKACLGHPARPTPCQGYVSIDLASCEADHADPPQRVHRPIASGILTDLVSGTRNEVLAAFGAPAQSVELTAALVAAWKDPGAESRWLAGERVLLDAISYAPPAENIPAGSA